MTQDGFGQFEDARIGAGGGVVDRTVRASYGFLVTFENNGKSSMLVGGDPTAILVDYAISKRSGGRDPPAETGISE